MKLVVVDWVDSFSGRGWQDMDALAGRREALVCRSSGWVVFENSDIITLASTVSNQEPYTPTATGDITIPKGCIRRITPAGRWKEKQ